MNPVRSKQNLGLFIVFEGVEGSGKTTQIRLLEKKLKSIGKKVISTHEPGGDYFAEKIRKLLLKSRSSFTPRADFFLFLASRSQHIEMLIQPALERGITVLCDRFEDSTRAYQHFGEGLGPLKTMDIANHFATNGLKPHVRILLDLDPVKGLRRKGKAALNRFDLRSLAFHQKVFKGFQKLASHGNDWLVIPGRQSRDAIHQMIWDHVSKLFFIYRNGKTT